MKKRSRESLLPDMTPLIDVVFLLLIFFMVSSVFKKDELTLLLSLPKTEKGEKTVDAKKLVVIELNTNQVALNGVTETLVTLGSKLSPITDKTTPVELRIDKEVKYQRVVTLLDLLTKYQLTNLSLITDK
ncbi:MAG: biopolymer transporter ExbD [Bacteriovoracaceae bacterium]|jgi:biopolymer transport protein ExbD|nr:biopolymer transporter ExbD [Bacteriovoracaceae bacterium]